jgi:hypothetical protein
VDVEGMHANSTYDRAQRVSSKGAATALPAGKQHPIAVTEDGLLYFASSALKGHLLILRLKPNGETFVAADIPDTPKGKKLRTTSAMSAGRGNSRHLAGNHANRTATDHRLRAVAGGNGLSALFRPEAGRMQPVKRKRFAGLGSSRRGGFPPGTYAAGSSGPGEPPAETVSGTAGWYLGSVK